MGEATHGLGEATHGLGEATHGTSELCRARAEITKRMTTEHGFTIIGVEADWPDAAAKKVRPAHDDSYERPCRERVGSGSSWTTRP